MLDTLITPSDDWQVLAGLVSIIVSTLICWALARGMRSYARHVPLRSFTVRRAKRALSRRFTSPTMVRLVGSLRYRPAARILLAQMRPQPFGPRLFLYAWAVARCAITPEELEIVALEIMKHGVPCYGLVINIMQSSSLSMEAWCQKWLGESDPRFQYLALLMGTIAPLPASHYTEFLSHPNINYRTLAWQNTLVTSHHPHPHLVSRLMGDPSWQVRAIGARLLGQWDTEDIALHLQNGLQDRHWWVRHNSAESLARMTDWGQPILFQSIAHDDRFAKDAAHDALRQIDERYSDLFLDGQMVPRIRKHAHG